jgi:exodeoxyribonuclease VII small subunit
MNKKIKDSNSPEPAFEEALEKLEELVEKMEEGDLPLDRMIECFERGSALANLCDKKLKALEKKIQVLVDENSEGGEWTDFDQSSERSNAIQENEPITKPDTESDADLLF